MAKQNLEKLRARARQAALFPSPEPPASPSRPREPAKGVVTPLPPSRPWPFVQGDLVTNSRGEVRKALTRSVLPSGEPFVFMVDAVSRGPVHISGYRLWSWVEVDQWSPMSVGKIAMDPRLRHLLPAVREARARAAGTMPVTQQIGRAIIEL